MFSHPISAGHGDRLHVGLEQSQAGRNFRRKKCDFEPFTVSAGGRNRRLTRSLQARADRRKTKLESPAQIKPLEPVGLSIAASTNEEPSRGRPAPLEWRLASLTG